MLGSMSAEPVTDLRTDEQRDVAAAARDRADRNAGHLWDLLARRPDLRGVHAPADWLEDAIRWTA